MISRTLVAHLLAMPLLAGAAIAQESGSPLRGFEYAAEVCSECHAIDIDDYESPRFEAPSFMEIANSGEMSEIALMPFFQTSHETMPNFVVPADSIRDLTAYILSLKE
jgi:mono/diheme cytochrome c family protein